MTDRFLPRLATAITTAAALILMAPDVPADGRIHLGPVHSDSVETGTAAAIRHDLHQSKMTSTSTWMSYPLFGGEMTSIAAHPAVAGTAWVGTRDAGVFKTIDGGQTWTPARNGLTFYPIRSLVVDPNSPSTLYAGTDFDGVWKSTDGGAGWFKSSSGLDDRFVIFTIEIDPTNTDIVFAGGFGGTANVIGAVYRSTDAGANWFRADAGIAMSGDTWVCGIKTLAIDPDVPTTLYAGTTYEGIFRTTNSGSSWAAVNDGVPWLSAPDYRRVIDALGVDHHHGGRPAAVISGMDYYVLDPSDVWQPLSHDFLSGRRLKFHPTVADTVMMAGGGFVWSTDGGLSWTDSGPLTIDFSLDAADPSTVLGARRVGFSEPGGVYLSSNAGASWGWSGSGIMAQTVRSLAVDPNDATRLYVGTGDGFLYRSVDGGTTWTRAVDASHPTSTTFGFEVLDVAVDPTDSNTVFLAGNDLYRSLDGGVSFAEIPLPCSPITIEITPDGTTIFVGCGLGGGVQKSTDGGDSWMAMHTGLPTFGGNLCPILSIALDPGDPNNTLWAGTQYGGGIVKSTNGGLSWHVMGLTDENFVFSIVVNPENANDILAGGGFWEGSFFRSTNGGQNWTTILDNIAFPYEIVYDPLHPGHVYAATEGHGVLQSLDGGATWTGLSDGIFYPVLYDLVVAPHRLLLTGSFGSGLYRLSLPPDPATVFADGFESGDDSRWSVATP